MSTTTSATHAHAVGACKETSFTRQFGHPTGFLGGLVGRLMAVKNAPLNELAVEVLAASPEDRVLEIGFGPGTAIEMLTRTVTRGTVAGVDLSAVMLQQASRRNRAAIDAGRVELRLGSVSHLPYDDASFDKALAVNTVHHWPNQLHDLQEVRRVLRDGGELLLCLRLAPPSPGRFTAPGLTRAEVTQVEELLRRAGYAEVHTELRERGREVACVKARR
jgi:ubiquinone/menaquinone biosynthesis C-methylase UbiE